MSRYSFQSPIRKNPTTGQCLASIAITFMFNATCAALGMMIYNNNKAKGGETK